MARDRSLDEFVGDDDTDTEGDPSIDQENASGGDDPEREESSDTGDDPAVSTYGWRPDGKCDRCERQVSHRWRADGRGLVCGSCKEW